MIYGIKNINDLPSPNAVRKRLQGLALADAILMPEWQYRYFSFNCNWDDNEMLASMRDGAGSEYFIHFSSQGVVGKVLSTELEASNSQLLLENVPTIFSNFKNESAFNIDHATYFFWKGNDDKLWSASPNNLVIYPLLGFLIGNISIYHNWAMDYYEKDIDIDVLEEIIVSLDVSPEQLNIINPDISLKDVSDDIREITRRLG
jgi:hypothetical protein